MDERKGDEVMEQREGSSWGDYMESHGQAHALVDVDEARLSRFGSCVRLGKTSTEDAVRALQQAQALASQTLFTTVAFDMRRADRDQLQGASTKTRKMSAHHRRITE